jgi:hypothetical protein
MKKKSTNDDLKDKDDEEGGDGGESGGGSGFVPSYYDLLGDDVDEIELAGLSAAALRENRIKVKAQGISVSALDKPQEARNDLNAEINANPGQDGGGLGLEQHPELAEMGGDVDPNTIVLPKSEQEALASNDMELKLQLLAEYKKKMDMKMGNRPAPEPPAPAPRMRPSAPPPRPRPF